MDARDNADVTDDSAHCLMLRSHQQVEHNLHLYTTRTHTQSLSKYDQHVGALLPTSADSVKLSAFAAERRRPQRAHRAAIDRSLLPAGRSAAEPDFRGPRGPSPRPPTNRGPPIKPFIFYFSLMIDAYESTT